MYIYPLEYETSLLHQVPRSVQACEVETRHAASPPGPQAPSAAHLGNIFGGSEKYLGSKKFLLTRVRSVPNRPLFLRERATGKLEAANQSPWTSAFTPSCVSFAASFGQRNAIVLRCYSCKGIAKLERAGAYPLRFKSGFAGV